MFRGIYPLDGDPPTGLLSGHFFDRVKARPDDLGLVRDAWLDAALMCLADKGIQEKIIKFLGEGHSHFGAAVAVDPSGQAWGIKDGVKPATGSTRTMVAVTRLVPAAASPARSRDFIACPVLNVIAETADIRTFRIARPEGFEFSAGQFIAVRVRAEGKEHVRCYSVSSPPAARGYLEIAATWRYRSSASGSSRAPCTPRCGQARC